MSNRLGQETSPYLRSAAHQPVDWFPWGDEAFARARAEDRPILLDVGAVWCHWCHVIDRESYDDPETARLINEHFVPVKVDRDERPDIDSRYQTAVQAISQQGGWPLTAFLTPEGKVFYGGTYFPPDDRYGRPGFRSVLRAVADFYRTQKARAVRQAEEVHGAIAEHVKREAQPGALSEALVEGGVNDIRYLYDVAYGGFGRQPKFFHAGALALYLTRGHRTREAWMLSVVSSTLDKMAKGGVYDQLGGAFHRYSVDDRWIVPHFEKMLYDNAALLSVYAEAGHVLDNRFFQAVADSILTYYDREGSDRERGGFYASQDADVGMDDDGDYFTWTVDEARAAVGDPDTFAAVQLRYNIYERGEMHLDPARNVLFVDAEIPDIANRLGKTEDEVRALLALGEQRLLAARGRRKAPYIDRSILLNWNGMMVTAYLDVFQFLGRTDAREFALKTLDRLLAQGRAPDGGLYHLLLPEGGGKHPGFLDDQVQVAWAALRAYETTGEGRYLEAAERLAAHVVERYWDDETGGCIDVARASAEAAGASAVLTQPQRPYADTPTPGANAVFARLLVRLLRHTGRTDYRERADRTLAAYAGSARGQGLMAATYFLAVEELLEEPAHVVVVGPRSDATRALHLAALRARRPGTVVSVVDRDAAVASPTRLPEAVRGMLAAATGPTAFVCSGSACAPPVTEPAALPSVIEGFSR
jgi:uncharacterized protein YyaL (SSP411 family)